MAIISPSCFHEIMNYYLCNKLSLPSRLSVPGSCLRSDPEACMCQGGWQGTIADSYPQLEPRVINVNRPHFCVEEKLLKMGRKYLVWSFASTTNQP